jgi:hypothetical protein
LVESLKKKKTLMHVNQQTAKRISPASKGTENSNKLSATRLGGPLKRTLHIVHIGSASKHEGDELISWFRIDVIGIGSQDTCTRNFHTNNPVRVLRTTNPINFITRYMKTTRAQLA